MVFFEDIAWIFDIALLMVLLYVSIWDLSKYRVSNIAIFIGFVIGVGRWYMCGGIASMLYSLGVSVIPILAMFLLFKIRVFGAGDIKLLSVIFCNYRIEAGSKIFLLSMILGAVFGAAKLIWHGQLFLRFNRLIRYIGDVIQTKRIERYYDIERDGTTSAVPFALCISVADLCYWGLCL